MSEDDNRITNIASGVIGGSSVQVGRAIAASRDGRGVLVLICGKQGVGKSFRAEGHVDEALRAAQESVRLYAERVHWAQPGFTQAREVLERPQQAGS